MNTRQAEYKTDIARLAEQMAQRDAKLAERDARLAERDAKLSERYARLVERDIANTRWIIGAIVAMSLLVIAAIKI